MDSEREALLLFKYGLIDEANRLASWVPENKECCRWVGITCDNTTGYVHRIHLRALDGHFDHYLTNEEVKAALKERLKGVISPSLLHLKQLKHLDLSYNDFGEIQVPKFIGSFENLRYLNLSRSNFSGAIPPQLGNLSELHTLCLGSATYDPFIVYERTSIKNMQWLSNLAMLHHLDISGVDLSEANNWFQVINTLPSLVKLYLSNCGLPDVHLHVLSLNITSLSILDLSDNEFNSSVPRWIFSTTSLVSLDITWCNFHSIIPTSVYSFRNFTSLKFLHAKSNAFMSSPLILRSLSSSNLITLDISACDVSSSVLESLRNLTSLRILKLSGNQLTRRIPTTLGNLCNLRELDLSSNNFRNIGFAYLLKSFFECKQTDLELSNNQIDGAIPHVIQQFSSLRKLDLAANQVSGPIPHSLGQLSSLEELSLGHNQLNGSLPQSLGQLSKLTAFDFSYNLLTGVVTEAHFAKLVNLKTLYGNSNNLTLRLKLANWIPPFKLYNLNLESWVLGPQFPMWLQSQIHLSYLDISNTSISSPIPESFFRSCRDLSLFSISHNHIRGTLMLSTIPSTLKAIDVSFNHFQGSLHNFLCSGGLKETQDIYLRHNHFTGVLPSCWEKFPNLFSLNVEYNNLSGEIPRTLGYLRDLNFLNMQGNKITGRLPYSLVNLTNLQLLLLGNNDLSGSIPTWIGTKLTRLIILDLRSNNFNRNIPKEVCDLASIRILDISHNNLSGNIPKCFNNFTVLSGLQYQEPPYFYSSFDSTSSVTRVTVVDSLLMKGREDTYSTILGMVMLLDLSSNNLSGAIPGELTSLQKIISLNLSGNQFTGGIPRDIGEMIELESLDLSLNKLSGELPMSLSRLNYLDSFNVSYNNLVGRIPTGTQIQSFDEFSFLGNKLYGAPLNETKSYVPDEVAGDTKQDQIKDDCQDWGLIVSIVLGFVTGFWMIVGPLIFKRSWRVTYFGLLRKLSYMFDDVIHNYW